MKTHCQFTILLGLLFIIFFLHLEPASSQSTQREANLVYPSPPCLAAKCKDGIALLSIHVQDHDMAEENSKIEHALLDTIGSVRIEELDETTILLNSGWRVDGRALADKGRDLCQKHWVLYGEEKGNEFGKHIGWGLVDYLVENEVQGSVRSLSTCGLLAATTRANHHNMELFLVHVSGLYPCRALAIGSHAQMINRALERVDFSLLTVQDGLNQLLEVLRQCLVPSKTQGADDDGAIPKDEKMASSLRNIPDDSLVECAIMNLSGKIIRTRIRIHLMP